MIDLAAGIGHRQQDAVELPAVKRVARRLAGILAQEQAQAGKAGAQDWQHGGQQERRDGRDHPHAQFAGQRLPLGARHVGQFLALAKHPHRLVGDAQTERREAHHAARALDQGRAKQGLKLAKSRRQRRLGDEATLRRFAEMAMRPKRDEILQLSGRRVVNDHWKIRSIHPV